MIILFFFLVSAFSFVLLNVIIKRKTKSTEKADITLEQTIEFIDNDKTKNLQSNNDKPSHTAEKTLLLSCGFIISFFIYGVLLGLQSYSTLSYGHKAFHMSINLGNLLLPVAIFVSIWSYDISLTRFLTEFIFGLGFSAYIVLVSFYSPCPPLVSHWSGSWIVVASWILAECIFTRLRCILASKLEKFKDEKLLLIFGSVSLLGNMIGGSIIYLMVDVYRVFKHKPDCVFDFSYCNPAFTG